MYGSQPKLWMYGLSLYERMFLGLKKWQKQLKFLKNQPTKNPTPKWKHQTNPPSTNQTKPTYPKNLKQTNK